MKKAKILVPAIAALVLSSAAAVTGTIAWFTSTTAADFEGSGLTVINASKGTLGFTLSDDTAGGKSTTKFHEAVPEPAEDAYIEHTGKLVDGSVDLTVDAPKIYEPADATASTFQESTTWKGSVEGSFRATKFTVTFNYKFFAGSGVNSVKLYFDGLNSRLLDTDTSLLEGSEYTILPALRIGFKNKVDNTYKVWAPFIEKTANGLGHIGAGPAKATYAKEQVIDEKVGVPADGTGVAGSASNLLGSMTASYGGLDTNTQNLAIDVYTWIEGEDAACDNASTLFAGITQDLHFGVLTDVDEAKK